MSEGTCAIALGAWYGPQECVKKVKPSCLDLE